MNPNTSDAVDVAALRAIQLQTLDTFANHCNAQGLTWYLCAGTLLGAVRHEGYIPWDDDLDVMLPRPHYEAFVKSFEAPRTDGLALATLENESAYPFPFAKLHRTDTIVQEGHARDANYGVFIDVFPIDYLPDRGIPRMLVTVALACLRELLQLRILGRQPGRAAWKNAALALLRHACAPLPHQCFGRQIDRIARWSDRHGSRRCGVIAWGYGESVPAAAYAPASTLTFEGRTLPAPASPHEVLSTIYGNYMALPPLEQRKTHHTFTAYRRAEG